VRRINTILLAFLAFVLIALGATWGFLQSRTFARMLSKSVTQASAQFGARVGFSRVSLRFFPPGLALENVRLSYAKDGTSVEGQAGELGVAFGLNSFTGHKPRVEEIYLREGWARVEIAPSDKPSEHPWDRLQQELGKLPVRISSVRVEEARVEVAQLTVDIHRFTAILGSKQINIEGEVKDATWEGYDNRLDLARARATLRRDTVAIDELRVVQKRSLVDGTGRVDNWNDLERLALSAKVNAELYLPDLAEFLPMGPVKFHAGFVRGTGEFSWSKGAGPKAAMDVRGADIASNVVQATDVVAKLSTEGEGLRLDSLALRNGDEVATLAKGSEIWHHSRKQLFREGLRLRLERFDLHNALTILGESLSNVQGLMTGELTFQLKGWDMRFYPADGFKLERVGLRVKRDDGSTLDVVRAPVLWLHRTELAVINKEFRMRGQIKAPRTQLDVEGYVGGGRAHFDLGPGNINLADLGDIADLGLKGEGLNLLRVRGPLDKVVMEFDGELRGFQLLGYRLGDTRQRLRIDLGKSQVDIPEFRARKGRHEYGGTGKVAWKDFLMDISIDIPEVSFTDLKDVVHPLAGGLAFLPTDFEGIIQGNVQLYARHSIRNLVVAADAYGQKLRAWGEPFRDLKFAMLYKERKIRLDGFSVTKDQGRLTGEIAYDLDAARTDYRLSLRGLQSSELNRYKRLPVAMDFRASGEFKGYHATHTWDHRGFLGLSSSRVLDRTIPDSTFEWDVKHDALSVDAKFARDWLTLSAQSQPNTGGRRVEAQIEANIPDLPLFMMALFGENPQLVNATGELAWSGKLALTNWEWNRLDLEAWMRRLSLKTPEVALDLQFPRAQVDIQGGTVRRWDIRVDTPDLRINSRAEGGLQSNLVIRNQLDMDAKLLELISSHVQRAEGRVTAEVKTTLTPRDVRTEIESRAEKIAVNTDLLPFPLGDLRYDIRYADRELELRQFSFRPDAGQARVTGTVLFATYDPEVNLRWFLESATFPVKNRTHVTANGDGMLFGNRRPYVLSGEVAILKGAVLNELGDFTSGTGETVDTKYLPPDKGGALAGLVNFDLSVRSTNPVSVVNSMMDLAVVADLQLTGDMVRPHADGKVSTAGVNPRVFFKNSEYQITKADFLFNGRKSISKPEFDVAAASTISNYRVTAKAYGNPDNFTFDLSSDPPLTKQNILSLIAFGYTDDLSNSIRPEDRQSLTNVGVGSFIFDQFKVTDIVKKQFGLQVNLGTVFMQSNESMLAGRTQGDGGATGVAGLARTRTATNIEVKKRLSEAMNLAVSSTVGGSIGQRQRMTLNYGLTRSMQLEGIYELRTNNEGQEDLKNNNSIGGDVKFRMTFR